MRKNGRNSEIMIQGKVESGMIVADLLNSAGQRSGLTDGAQGIVGKQEGFMDEDSGFEAERAMAADPGHKNLSWMTSHFRCDPDFYNAIFNFATAIVTKQWNLTEKNKSPALKCAEGNSR